MSQSSTRTPTNTSSSNSSIHILSKTITTLPIHDAIQYIQKYYYLHIMNHPNNANNNNHNQNNNHNHNNNHNIDDRILQSFIFKIIYKIIRNRYITKEMIPIICQLIYQFDKDILLQQQQQHTNNHGDTLLHIAIKYSAPNEIIYTIINKGGKTLLLQRNFHSFTAFEIAITLQRTSIDIILKLIDVCGKDLVMKRNCNGYTILHYILQQLSQQLSQQQQEQQYRHSTTNNIVIIAMKLIDIGGIDLIMSKNNYHGIRPLSMMMMMMMQSHISGISSSSRKPLLVKPPFLYNSVVDDDDDDDEYDDNDIMVVDDDNDEIDYDEIDDDLSICGLFTSRNQKIDHPTFRYYWPFIARILNRVFVALDRPLPLLHAMIIHGACKDLIIDILHRFDKYDLFRIKDRKGRLPIDVAVEVVLPWSNGMKEIFDLTSSAITDNYKRSRIYIACEHGIPWGNHFHEMIESNIEEIIHGYDHVTGLKAFMIASMGKSSDLSVIYTLIRMDPGYFA